MDTSTKQGRNIHSMKPDFGDIDLSRHVYLKPIVIEGRPACTVHDADGVCLWFETDMDSAREDLDKYDVVELTLH